MAIVRYAGNRMTGVSGDTKPTEGSLITGTTFHETNTDDLYLWDGDSWELVASGTALRVKEISAPGNQATNYGVIYVDTSDEKLYYKFESDSAIDLTAGSEGGEANESSFKTISVSGQDNVVADSDADTLTIAAGSNMTITTTAGSDTITFAASGGTQNVFQTIAVSGQSNVVADSSTDTLTLVGGSNITLTTNASTDTVTIASATGVSALDGLSDVTIASAADAHVLIYDNGDSRFENKAISGDITINASGVTAIGVDKVTGTMIHANAVDDSSLEQSGTAFRVKATGVTNAMLAGSIANAKLANSTITIGATSTALGGTITALTALTDLDLTSGDKTIFDTVGSNTLTIGASGTTVNIAGNLTIAGTTTTVDSTTVAIGDGMLSLAKDQTGTNTDAVDVGFYGTYDAGGTDKYAGFFRDANDSGKFKLFKDLQAAPTTTVNTSGTGYAVGTLVADVVGAVTGALTGNADTVTNGVYTTGNQTIAGTKTFSATITGDISGNAGGTSATVTGGTQAAITSAANLVTVGTIGTGVWNGTALVQAYIGAEAINESKLQVSNGPTNGYVLSAQSGNTGGMTWVAAGSGEANEYSFKTIVVSGQSNVVADTTTDTLTLVAGTNMTITTSADTITLTAAGASGASESFAIAMAVAL